MESYRSEGELVSSKFCIRLLYGFTYNTYIYIYKFNIKYLTVFLLSGAN